MLFNGTVKRQEHRI